MALDLSNSRKGYPDRCKWYKGNYVVNMKLVPNAACEGVFYSTDKVALSKSYEILFGNTGQEVSKITIETNDNVRNMKVNDYVLYAGELWRVVNLPEINDVNENKYYSSRPRTTTIIELRK